MGMRIILALVAVLAIGGGIVANRSRAVESKPIATAEKAATAPAPSAAPSVSQHNWPKKALDRAGDVKRQVLEGRKTDGAN